MPIAELNKFKKMTDAKAEEFAKKVSSEHRDLVTKLEKASSEVVAFEQQQKTVDADVRKIEKDINDLRKKAEKMSKEKTKLAEKILKSEDTKGKLETKIAEVEARMDRFARARDSVNTEIEVVDAAAPTRRKLRTA